MINERKEKVITLLIQGEKYVDIAKLVGINRLTIYNWLENEEFKAELNKRKQEISTQGNNIILTDISLYVGELKRIGLTARSERERSLACMYLVDRVLGKSTNKIELTNDDNKDVVQLDMLTEELQLIDDGE